MNSNYDYQGKARKEVWISNEAIASLEVKAKDVFKKDRMLKSYMEQVLEQHATEDKPVAVATNTKPDKWLISYRDTSGELVNLIIKKEKELTEYRNANHANFVVFAMYQEKV